MAEAFEVTLTLERETKNTKRFAEQERADGLPPVIGTIYVSKWACKQMGDPTTLGRHGQAVKRGGASDD